MLESPFFSEVHLTSMFFPGYNCELPSRTMWAHQKEAWRSSFSVLLPLKPLYKLPCVADNISVDLGMAMKSLQDMSLRLTEVQGSCHFGVVEYKPKLGIF